MRSSELFEARQMTSSRQSPRMSPDRTGFDLVPLFEELPVAVNKVLAVCVEGSHLVMLMPSSNSRVRSASHQTTLLTLGGAVALMTSPVSPRRRPPGAPHASTPG